MSNEKTKTKKVIFMRPESEYSSYKAGGELNIYDPYKNPNTRLKGLENAKMTQTQERIIKDFHQEKIIILAPETVPGVEFSYKMKYAFENTNYKDIKPIQVINSALLNPGKYNDIDHALRLFLGQFNSSNIAICVTSLPELNTLSEQIDMPKLYDLEKGDAVVVELKDNCSIFDQKTFEKPTFEGIYRKRSLG